MFKGIDHILVAVNDLQAGQKDYETKLGLKVGRGPFDTPSLGIKGVVFPLSEPGRFIELIAPLGPETVLARTVARRGEGLHLVAMAVQDRKKAIAELKAKGVRLIEDGEFVFIHPKETHGVLFELVERQ
ncbi:MAG: VOC family protein [Chloroflexi bacterium]|nr:VOC family protein [Chloroflexota bacterium]